MNAKRISYLLGMLLILFVTGCSKDSVTPDAPSPAIPDNENKEMILNDNTVSLTTDFINHVETPVTGMEIIVDASLKQTSLPRVGQILLNMESSEKFPYGFLGKVSQINKDDNNRYRIITEKAYLDEAFEKLHVEDSFEIDLSDLTNTRSKDSLAISPYTEDGYTGIMFTYTKKELFHCTADSYFTVKLGYGIIVNYIIDINNQIKKPLISFTIKNKLFITPSMKIELEKKVSQQKLFQHNLATLSLKPKNPGEAVTAIILRPKIEFNFIAEATGSCNFESDVDLQAKSVLGMEYRNEKKEIGWKLEKGGLKLASSNKFSMDGDIFAGLQCALKAQLFSENIVCISVPFSIGLQLSANISAGLIAEKDYSTFCDATAKLGLPHYKVEADFDLFKIFKKDFTHDCLHFDFIEGDVDILNYRLFPKFENMTATRNKDDKTKAIVSSNVTQDLFVPVDIDYELFSKDGEVTNVEEWTKYHFEEEMENPFVKDFNGLRRSWEYRIQPIIKMPIFGEIKASPIKVIEKEVMVETIDATQVTKESLSFSGRFDPEITEISTYGICYSTAISGPTITNSSTINATGHDNGIFSVSLTPISKETTYYYRAFIATVDSVYYGNVKSFKTKEEEQEDVGEIVGFWETYKLVEYVMSTGNVFRETSPYPGGGYRMFSIFNKNGNYDEWDTDAAAWPYGSYSVSNGILNIHYQNDEGGSARWKIISLTSDELIIHGIPNPADIEPGKEYVIGRLYFKRITNQNLINRINYEIEHNIAKQ